MTVIIFIRSDMLPKNFLPNVFLSNDLKEIFYVNTLIAINDAGYLLDYPFYYKNKYYDDFKTTYLYWLLFHSQNKNNTNILLEHLKSTKNNKINISVKILSKNYFEVEIIINGEKK